ncbi:MAG: hypothetical protein HOB84_07305 [Candidatus Marinimicrobia bacterium]|jgi:hypothetical protein|nr:hypothetical protein [Candidatus Neomarinimicrobiota bacterium]MBT4360345.1 hypothetical protein [Candidatus Neomarinimicrobiota bacterium]MBT4714562.1 hypothetical protein [Candidatus Neomarinimicrobiota bacterium]MBT4946601.1 hypothetical protein [Candidatus Neomarinimicrobiota bacterium]MBT5270320.1 hypothetical protein [Candidatus Neomarinimicrobiota bacterium]
MSNRKQNLKGITMKRLLVICMLCVAMVVAVFPQTIEGPAQTEAFLESSATTEFVPELNLHHDAMVKSKLSTIWTAVTLNMIAADVLSLYIPEGMDEYTDFADGKEAELMTAAAVMYQIPISMVFLSKVLPYKANRRANMIAAGLMTLAVVGGGSTDPHYMIMAGAEIVGFSLIAWNAYKWTSPEGEPSKHNLGLNMNYERKALGLSYRYNF